VKCEKVARPIITARSNDVYTGVGLKLVPYWQQRSAYGRSNWQYVQGNVSLDTATQGNATI
jgi:hypothetical protein